MIVFVAVLFTIALCLYIGYRIFYRQKVYSTEIDEINRCHPKALRLYLDHLETQQNEK